MAKITEYPRATKFDANDVLLKDGTNGTKTITVEDFVNDVSDTTNGVEGKLAKAEDISNLKSDLNYSKTASIGSVLTATNSGNGSKWSLIGLPVNTASDNILDINNNLGSQALSKLIVDINPGIGRRGTVGPTNPRPLTGYTTANITQARKNLFDKNHYTKLKISCTATSGSTTGYLAGVNQEVAWMQLPGGVTYTITCSTRSSTAFRVIATAEYPIATDAYKTPILLTVSDPSADTITFNAPADMRWIGFNLRVASTTDPANIDAAVEGLQIEVVSTETEYEAFLGEHLSVDFPSEAGTVYAGTLDVVAGTLTVTHVFMQFDGTETWEENTSGTYPYFRTDTVSGSTPKNNASGWCSHFEWKQITNANQNIGVGAIYGTRQIVALRPGSDVASTVEELTAWLAAQAAAGTPLQVVYPLLTPVVYQFAGEDFTLAQGNIFLWTDCGPLQVSYLQDIKNTIEEIRPAIDNASRITKEMAVLKLHAIPETPGVLNCIKRARQCTDIEWTPSVDVPRVSGLTGDSYGAIVTFADVYSQGKKYKGIPYSSARTELTERYGYQRLSVGNAVPFEAFLTAVSNPKSIVALESHIPVPSDGYPEACAYGLTCTRYVAYCYGWDNYLYDSSTIANAPGISRVSNVSISSFDLKSLKLCDMLLYSGHHAAIITDIVKNGDDIIAIEVSESTISGNYTKELSGSDYGGCTRRKMWLADDFVTFFALFNVYRNSLIDNVTYKPNKYVDIENSGMYQENPILPCIPYMGENFIYKYGYVYNSTLLTRDDNAYFTHISVTKDGAPYNSNGTTDNYQIDASGVTEIGFSQVGEYTARPCRLVGSQWVYGKSCHWKVEE